MLLKNAIDYDVNQSGLLQQFVLSKKASGAWRPVLNLSKLNLYVIRPGFYMETSKTILASIQRDDWMVSLVMKDSYYHIPIHPESRPYLRFVFNNQVF